MFAVVDVETTGGHPSGHAITEIAIVISDGISIIDQYSSLVNPQQNIPLNIESLTGISNAMVADSPKFSELAKEIKDFLGDHIFVAHNVNFDLGFIQHAFKREGFDYNPKRLCSVRYARRVAKGLRSYSLKNLCQHFSITNAAAHRAWGDAIATAKIMGLLLEADKSAQWQQMIKRNQGEINLPPHLPAQEYQDLPEKPGVYYFYNQEGKPIYIGKATNLKRRVASHFSSDKSTKRAQAFKRDIYHVHFELTGSELLASLLEDHEIRHYWPEHNRAQKKPKNRFGVFHYKNQEGQYCLVINRLQKQHGYLADFYSLGEAQNWLLNQVENHRLNPQFCGLTSAYLPPANEKTHNPNFEKLLHACRNEDQHFLIKTRGRHAQEQGFAWVANGQLKGIGFIEENSDFSTPEAAIESARLLNNSITTTSIIRRVLEEQSHNIVPVAAQAQLQDGLLF